MKIIHRVKFVTTLLPKRFRGRLWLTGLTILTAAFCHVLAPLMFKGFIDSIVATPRYMVVVPIFLSFISLVILDRLLSELKFVTYSKFEQALVKHSLATAYQKLIQSTPAFFQNTKAGDTSARVFRAVLGLKSFLLDIIAHLMPLLLNFIFILVIVSYVFSQTLAACVFLGVTSYITTLFVITRRLWTAQSKLRDSTITTQATLTEIITCWKDIKCLRAYKHTTRYFDNALAKMENTYHDFYKLRSFYGLILTLPLLGLLIVTNSLVIHNYMQSNLSLGSLVLINYYLLQLAKPLESLGLVFRHMSRAFSDFASLETLINQPREFRPKKPAHIERIHNISIRNLNIPNILFDINLTLKKGDRIALIGPPGSGKTTLLNVLCGIITKYNGEITLDKSPLETLSVDVLRRHVKLISGNSHLFTASIRDNILVSDDCDLQRYQRAITSMGLQEKIAAASDSLIIGDQRLNLSAAEKARIRLARLATIPCRVKLYDEMTTSLDSLLSKKIIKHLIDDDCDIMICATHDLSLLNYFNKVIAIENGSIIEEGHPADCQHILKRYEHHVNE